MAVYCGVCGTRLDGAWENGGSFPVDASFPLWNATLGYKGHISDTCERCAAELKKAVAKAAKAIARRNVKRLAGLRKEAEEQAARARQRLDEEREVRAELERRRRDAR